MKHTAREYAVLSNLLDEALDLPEDAREAWVASISEAHADLAPTLRRMLLTRSARETRDAFNMLDRIAAVASEAVAQTELSDLQAGGQVGPYALIRELGRGGMGSVWLASRADGAFRRSVALKLPHIAWAGNLKERMFRERDILAALEHSNIARFYDAGVDERGRPYMALEYVEGRPIDVYCRELNLTIRERLTLILEVAKAVAFAHSKLVIHRDLKPSNILVTANGEIRLLDFGIAKIVEGESSQQAKATEFAGRLLTPDYASPEQIKGESIGTATDVYSLAVLAYELLTEARPYRLKHQSVAELEQAIADADPMLASDAAEDTARKKQLRGDLDVILNKAMKKDPADRYLTVEAFASDVQRHLDGHSVLAQPDRLGYRLRKFAGRNRGALIAGSLIALALMSATVISTWQAREARREAEKSKAMKDFLLHVFTAGDNRASSSKPAGERTALELLDQGSSDLVNSLDTQPAVKAELIENMGDVYEGLDRSDKAIELYQVGVKLVDRTLGPNSREKAPLLARIVAAYVQRGSFEQAEKLLPEAEAAFAASGDHTSEIYALFLKTKGNILRRHGMSRMAEARDTLQQAAALFERYPPQEGYVGTMMYLTGVHVSLDEIPEAKKAADAAVSTAETLKNDASELANAITMRASVEDQLGDLAAAERDLVKASDLYASSVGKKHFLYLQNENTRGQFLQRMGKRDQGLPLMEDTAAQIAVIRPGSNTLANTLLRLAEAYMRDGVYAKALATIDEGLKISAAKENILLLTRLLLDRAQSLVQLGRFAEALDSVAQASKATQGTGAPANLEIATWEQLRASSALAQDDLNEATQRIALAISLSQGDTRRARYQRTRLTAIAARIAAARGETAVSVAEAGAARNAVAAADLNSEVFLQAEVAAANGVALCASGDATAGLRSADEALDARRVIQSPTSPFLAMSQVEVASCALGLGQVDRAKDLLAEAKTILQAQPDLGPQFQRAWARAMLQYQQRTTAGVQKPSAPAPLR
jgi:eukaryotic-like serine/threonine-protein kinase